jgi:uncharacterized membrane protein YeaQ/YmgE (transglycosylase-associated protein family)
MVDLNPGGILMWIVVGLLAGWITGLLMRGGGYGIIGDLILGLVGALVGGFLASFFIAGSFGFIGSLIIAILGAVIVVALVRLLTGSRAAAV